MHQVDQNGKMTHAQMSQNIVQTAGLARVLFVLGWQELQPGRAQRIPSQFRCSVHFSMSVQATVGGLACLRRGSNH